MQQRRVRDTMDLFFKSFERLATESRVARVFEENRQPFPRRDCWESPGVTVTWGPSEPLESGERAQESDLYWSLRL